MSLSTPLTKALGITHPVMLAGMDTTAGSEMVAAVANAGGFGCLGGVAYTPKVLREMIAETKAKFKDPKTPFGVDLLLPQVGGSARKTNVSGSEEVVWPQRLIIDIGRLYKGELGRASERHNRRGHEAFCICSGRPTEMGSGQAA